MKLERLGWNMTPARFEMSGGGALNVLKMRTEKPVLEMRSHRPVVKIDQSQCFAEAGLKGMTDFRVDTNSYAQSAVAKGIARIVDNGNEMMAIENGVDAIAEQADNNAFGIFEQEFVYTAIPKSRPKISVDPWTMNYSYTPGRIINETEPKRVQTSYTPPRFEYYVK